MKAFIRVVNKINESMMWVVGTLVLIMGILLCYAVVMRYFFNNPPLWSFDFTGWFTGLAAFLGGGYALLHGAHVQVDIFYEKFSLRTKSWVNIISFLVIFMIVAVLTWKGIEQVIFYFQAGAVLNTGLNIYIWIQWLMVPIGGILLGLQALVNLIKDIYIIRNGKPMDEYETIEQNENLDNENWSKEVHN